MGVNSCPFIITHMFTKMKGIEFMNKQSMDIMCALLKEPYVNQRLLTEITGYSLGSVNKSVKELMEQGLLDESMQLTAKAMQEFEDKKPDSAIILAAGVGMRMVPINTEYSKALIEVKGETLIERLIKQLHECGIHKIYVVVGYMKEQFEYLIDDYDVELIVNKDYRVKNNLHSLNLASNYLGNTYVVPCDLWCEQNPFRKNELYSWYMMSDIEGTDSGLRVNRKMEVVKATQSGDSAIGISYLLKEDSEVVKERLQRYDLNPEYDNAFWEETLYEGTKMRVPAKLVKATDVIEINTYEQLRELDEESTHLKTEVIDIIASALHAKANEIKDIQVLKKGMTNRSFIFECKNKRYIMRIPGEGTDSLINRREEAAVYEVIGDQNICDDIRYINPSNGYKITGFLEGARACDADNLHDVESCMKKLKAFHALELRVDHEFDIFAKIDFYESLWGGCKSVYRDYEETKERVKSLQNYVEQHIEKKCLTHIDAVPDNFLFVNGDNDIRLIDWEYAGMQDPHVDIAMFCIYALYNQNQVDELIDIYFEHHCTKETRLKIYCYIAMCGLLWSNWCEYKRNLGVEFGEYSLRQYRYAKEYYKIVKDEIEHV